MVQRGPYTFRAEKHRVHVQNDHDSDTLSYETVTSYKFDSNNSCEVCQSTDHMIFVNIPLVTLIHLGRTHHKFPARFLPELNKAILWNGSHPDSVVTFMKVDEFLFNGWNPPCLQWFREAFPHLEQYLPERFYPEGFALQKSSIVSEWVYSHGQWGGLYEVTLNLVPFQFLYNQRRTEEHRGDVPYWEMGTRSRGYVWRPHPSPLVDSQWRFWRVQCLQLANWNRRFPIRSSH